MNSIALAAGLLASTFISTHALAGTFEAGIPTGWTCTGTCGASAADGVVPLATGGGTKYGWVATTKSAEEVSLPGVGGNGVSFNGSALRSIAFNATAGAELDFRFNYTTSDGAGYADYAWARLLDSNSNAVALLVTARSSADGKVVPGFDMPASVGTLTPSTVSLTAEATKWSPLGDRSDKCYDTGCGTTGWVQSKYTIAANGVYHLEFGVANWDDGDFGSGLAFDAITLGGAPLPVPEPASYGMLLAGMTFLGAAAKRRKRSLPGGCHDLFS
jgi:hypothetical protein